LTDHVPLTVTSRSVHAPIGSYSFHKHDLIASGALFHVNGFTVLEEASNRHINCVYSEIKTNLQFCYTHFVLTHKVLQIKKSEILVDILILPLLMLLNYQTKSYNNHIFWKLFLP